MKNFVQFPFARNMMFAALSLLLLSGCVVKRDKYDVPALNLPAQFSKAPTAVDAPHALNSPTPPSTASSLLLNAELTEWWQLLGSQELNGLMDRALANNPDLRISTLRIAQSKARLSQAGANKVPTVSMPIQSSITYPEFGAGRGNANGINTARPSNQISLKGDWRPDIWGESAALYEAAELQLLRATYQRDDMQRNVVANVVVAYIEYLSLNDRLRIARETEKSLSEMLASVDGRLKVGDATITEMEQQNAAVYSVKATIPLLGQQREIVLNRLAALLGSAPVEMKLSHSGLNSVKFPQVLPDMPSALLLRRPDVRATEFRLLSADADIDVARARILPPLDLTAQVGYGSMYMSQLFLPQALFWNTIANLSVSIFDGGKRAKEVEFARAVHEELLETYVRVIYDAVREVDDSLSALNYTGKRLEAQELAADSSLRAWNYSKEAFMAGAVDYLVLLDTQRTYQRNLDDWYNVRIDRYRSLINLLSALGGGIPNNDASHDEEIRIQTLNKEVATASSRKTEQAERNQDEANKSGSIDWTGSFLKNGKTHWLVELSGVYDGGAVLPAWRDLSTRFPREIGSCSLLPQRQGQIKVRDKERASWYRLFVAKFPDKHVAEEFCAILGAGQQRCSVVSSESIEEKGDFVAPATLAQLRSSATWDDVAVKTITPPPPDSNGKNPNPLNTRQDAVEVQEEQSPALPPVLAMQTAIPVETPVSPITLLTPTTGASEVAAKEAPGFSPKNIAPDTTGTSNVPTTQPVEKEITESKTVKYKVADLKLIYNIKLSKLKKKAESGDAAAQTKLGWYYSSGIGGVTLNKTEAVFWYKKAAAQGDIEALVALGWIYSSGDGVTADLNEAAVYCRRAAGQGSKKAADMLKNIEAATAAVATKGVDASPAVQNSETLNHPNNN